MEFWIRRRVLMSFKNMMYVVSESLEILHSFWNRFTCHYLCNKRDVLHNWIKMSSAPAENQTWMRLIARNLKSFNNLYLLTTKIHENMKYENLYQFVISTDSIIISLNSFTASGDFCHLLITFENSLDPDQNVGPDLDPNCMTLWWYSWKTFLKNLILKNKNPQTTKKHIKLPSMQRVNLTWLGSLASHIKLPSMQRVNLTWLGSLVS